MVLNRHHTENNFFIINYFRNTLIALHYYNHVWLLISKEEEIFVKKSVRSQG